MVGDGSGAPGSALEQRLGALLAELGVAAEPMTVADHSAVLGTVTGVLPDRVLDLAVTESGRRRLRAELRGRRWAEERGIGVPEVLAAADDGRWLLSRRLHPAPSGGPRWTEAAVDAAVRIAPLPAPSGAPWRPASGGGLSRLRGTVQDTGRLVRAGVPLGEVRAVRAAAAQLPLSEVTHGDLCAANAVLDADRGLVVLEWTGVRAASRHRDLLTLWASTPDEEDRAEIADVVLDRTAGWEGPDVGLLWHAIALEQLVERVTGYGWADGPDVGAARQRLAEARQRAVELGSPVPVRG
ncbi:hypothetical protein [Trujillonella endophytica]|uniref:Aminoglycoside phosphotransferase n=1 Tax=Trujillonella endophytica TaxID=673521 RepID=A0A1H8RWP3_9ACTN|nr:hypothetical protein [Trujillella endophytica]SEO71069.1 Aminoglycoside phosphotransferase [Trujillella endophytica]